MRARALPLLLALACTLTAPAQIPQPEWPKEGEVYKDFMVDLDRDGRNERVGLAAYDVAEDEYWGQLCVWNAQGAQLWSSPRVKDAYDRMAFGAWAYGVSEIEVVGDLDGDGAVELISPAPVSDVRPPTFRVFRWNGKAFVPLFERTLREKPAGSDHYRWSKGDDYGPGARWISRFQGLDRSGKCVVDVVDFASNENIKSGTASVQAEPNGFRIANWVNRPR